jgi:tRNA (adenine-N(1)-)-methyltransferase non-catalytic subunit
MSTTKEESMKAEDLVPKPENDPFLVPSSNVVSDGDFVLLVFADKRQIFAQALSFWRGKCPPLKIKKRSYSTANLIGLNYGTVLELDMKNGLVPLPDDQDVIPDSTIDESLDICDNDNRDLLDTSESQNLTEEEIVQMRADPSVSGSSIVKAIIQNSSTFESKTSFSKAKYIKKKQIKYQPRCRLTKCTASTVCRALHLKDARRMMNLRDDSLAQILSNANVSAGCKILCFDTCCGVVTGACAERMGGYGLIHSIYTGQAPNFVDLIARFNLSFVQHSSIKWLHAGQVFHDDVNPKLENQEDHELTDRKRLIWPCCLQSHTQKYVEKMKDDDERLPFMNKRASRFTRKMTRPTSDEVLQSLEDESKKCDSLILACNYDPTHTLLKLLPYLGESCPFVVFYEYLEPLVECFRELQKLGLAINLRLTDTWMREYQILPNRSHPNMNMSQNGGFILTGVKLCPIYGKNEISDEIVKNFRKQFCGRTGRKRKAGGDDGENNKRKGRR